MPVLTKARPKVKIDVDDEVETKEETESIVDKGLASLIKEWDQASKKADSYFLRVTEYVIENEITKEMLKKALIDLRHMQDLTAANEVSKIMKAAKHPDLVQQALDKKITVRHLREAVTTKRDETDAPEKVLDKRLRVIAAFGIRELTCSENMFLRKSKDAYKYSYTKAEAKAAKAEEGEEIYEGEAEGETED